MHTELYSTNPTIIKLKDSTGNKEMAELRGTARIGLGGPVFHPGAQRCLSPQLQMSKFYKVFFPGAANTLAANFSIFQWQQVWTGGRGCQ